MADVILAFDQHYDRYNGGELAGFSSAAAERILGVRRADKVTGGKAPVAHLASPAEIERAQVQSAGAASEPEGELKIVRFHSNYGRYTGGEVAGFAPHVADVLVRGGMWNGRKVAPVANYFEPPKTGAMASEPEPGPAPEPELASEVEPPKRSRGGRSGK